MTIRDTATNYNSNNNQQNEPDFLISSTTGLADYTPPQTTAPFEPEITLQATESSATSENQSDATNDNALVVVPSSNVLVDHSDAEGNPYQYTTITAQAPIVSLDPSPTRTHFTDSRGRLRPVKPKKAHLPDTVLEFKEKRQFRTAASTWTGAGVGLVFGGPIGAAVGGLTAYGISKGVGKNRERRMMKRFSATRSPGAAVHVDTGVMT